jgi:hypothetical protein
MRKTIICCALAVFALSSAGCCRLCCWQRGGSFYNGYCYPAMPPPAIAPQQAVPTQTYAQPYAQPCACQ